MSTVHGLKAAARRSAYALSVIIAAVMSASSAHAISVGPALYSVAFTSVPGAVNVSGATSPQSGTYSFFGGSLDVSASAAATAQPATTATLTSGGCTPDGCAGGYYGASAQLTYEISVDGADGVSVPFYFQMAGGISNSGGPSSPGGSVQVRLQGPTVFTVGSILTGSGDIICNTDCINSTQHVSLLTNAIYQVMISANVSAYTNYAQTMTAWADPYIYIDPSFAGGERFSLLISSGIGNAPVGTTPLPDTFPLFASVLLGSAAIGWWRRRKNRASPIARG